MNIKILKSTENPEMERKEFVAMVVYDSTSPSREALCDELAKSLKTEKSNIVVNSMKQGYGTRTIEASVFQYHSAEKLKKQTAHHQLVRHKLAEKKVKAN